MNNYPTDALEKVLKNTSPTEFDDYIKEHADSIASGERPFADYMRITIKQKGLSQQTVIERAGFSAKYGYLLLAQLKNTRQRDYILRLCLAAEMSLSETQRALKLYGMSELYAKIPRDAIMIIALNRGIHSIAQVNEMLTAHEMEPLRESTQP